MDVPVLWLAGSERLVGKVGEDEGDGLALREKGDEILFAPYDSKPMKWVPITEFVVLEPSVEGDEDAGTDDPPAELPAEEVQPPETPFPRRKRE